MQNDDSHEEKGKGKWLAVIATLFYAVFVVSTFMRSLMNTNYKEELGVLMRASLILAVVAVFIGVMKWGKNSIFMKLVAIFMFGVPVYFILLAVIKNALLNG